MSNKSKRLCSSPKDIAIILDISVRQASRRYSQAKDAYGRLPHQQLTFSEFAEYYGLPLDELYARVR